jgi:flagellin
MAAGVVVNTNISSIHASRVLSTNRNDLETAMARLASGKRVNSAADDAAAASVALKMKADIASGDVAVRNINDGISLFQTFDGAASEVENILVRMRELASQMNNGTYASADRTAANTEYTALIAEIDRIADRTDFNRTNIGSNTTGVLVQLGAAGADQVTFSKSDLSTDAIGVAVSGSTVLTSTVITDQTTAAAAIVSIDHALAKVSTARATAGSNINRLGFALSNAQNVSQRLNEALSGLQDTDYAAESANLARGMVLAQAGTAMLAQANQAPQYVLTLLRG